MKIVVTELSEDVKMQIDQLIELLSNCMKDDQLSAKVVHEIILGAIDICWAYCDPSEEPRTPVGYFRAVRDEVQDRVDEALEESASRKYLLN